MKVILTEFEINEAIREWCVRRNIPVTNKSQINYSDGYSGKGVTSLNAAIPDITLVHAVPAPKDTPYR